MLKKLGPGLLVAAAGIGAGDMIISIQIGLAFKWTFVLAVILTALLKYEITEGIARHKLATGRSVIQYWNKNIPIGLRIIFIAFFIIWSFMVGAALLSASGLAAHAILPFLSENNWAIILSLLAFLMVYFGNYQSIEDVTKFLILLLFLILIPTAIILFFKTDIVKMEPADFNTPTLLMSIIGGVGGSVTMLSYTYWLQEKNWTHADSAANVRFDLRFSYAITAFFIFSLMIISSRLIINTTELKNSELIFGLGELIGSVLGNWGELLFKFCFFGVAFSSLLTVWSGVPYLFADFSSGFSKNSKTDNEPVQKSTIYKIFLLFLSIAPLSLTFLQSTIKNVINYTLISSVFVVGISITLLIINSKKKLMGDLVNTQFSKITLTLSILVFAGLLIWQSLH
jgi:Mn2+/Fe2+ NRAMP family transporter